MAHRAVARRHKAIHRAAKRRPSTLAKVGALLAAPVPDVELLIAAMANPDSGIKFVLGIARKAGTRVSEVQSVIFDKLKWTADAAKGWLRDHGFTGTAKDEGATFWRFRQQSPGKYKEFRTVVPGMRRNPTPSESISSYQEHLGTTTSPEFQSATPGEQAAAMTAQDLCENPQGGFWILSYSKQLSSTPPDENDIAHGPFDLILSDTRVEILKRGKGRGEKQRFLIKADRYGKPYWGWVDRSLLYRVPASSISADSQAEQNPRPIVVVHVGTGVKVGDFDTREEARRWIDGLRVSPSYKDQLYRIKTADEWWATHPSNQSHRNPEPMGSGPMETRKLLLIDVKFSKSAEKLGRIIGVARSQGWPEVVEAAEAKAKRLKIQPEVLDRHAAKIVPWRNPESTAADLYEEFHGKPPGETLEIVTEKHEHEWLTQLGVLVELKVATLTNLEATIRFDKDAPQLCSSEDGRQLYIEGGDQSIDLKALKMDGAKWRKYSMALGVLVECTYQTEKGFQNFQLTDYYHHLGEETGVQPFLLYDPNSQLLSVAGGQYEVKPEGIVN